MKKRGLRAGFKKRDVVVRLKKAILEIFETVKGNKNKIQNKISWLAALDKMPLKGLIKWYANVYVYFSVIPGRCYY